MNTEKRKPENFKAFPNEPVMSNAEDTISSTVKDAIQGKELYSTFTAWDFFALVWWDMNSSTWCAEVWQDKEYTASYEAAELEDLGNEINANHSTTEDNRFSKAG